MVFVVAERGESFLWCAWTRRQLCWRYSSGDDRSECDRVHWRLTNCDLRWLECPLSHTLWPKAQCFSVAWACLYCCWTTKEEENQISKSSLSKYLGLLYKYVSIWLFVERLWCEKRRLWDWLSNSIWMAKVFMFRLYYTCGKIWIIGHYGWKNNIFCWSVYVNSNHNIISLSQMQKCEETILIISKLCLCSMHCFSKSAGDDN